MIKGRFTEAIGLWLFATLLPFLKEIKLEHKPIRLPFLYKGSYEYIRMFRQSFWIYALRLAFFHSRNRTRKYKNRQKCCVVLWGIDYRRQAICNQWTPDIFFISKISRLYAVSNRKVSHGMFSSPPFLSA